MPRGVRREKTVRLTEELEQVNEALNKSMRTTKTLQARKQELEKELMLCEKESVIKVVKECGLNPDELKAAIETFKQNTISA